MNISIIGSGNMGSALGKRFVQLGHSVLFSFSHSNKKLEELSASVGGNAKYGSPSEAAQFGNVVLLTVPWSALEEAISAANSSNALAGKIIITTTSPNQPDFEGNATGLKTASDISAAERIAQLLPDTKVVEAFNLTFAEIIEDETDFKGEKPSLFYCGDDAGAKKTAATLVESCGYEAIDAGGLKVARSLELLSSAWVQMAAASEMFPNVALKVLRK